MRGHFAEDITGNKYGELLVISRSGRQGGRAMWLCKCSCGKETVVRSDHLKSGRIISCGHVGRANCIESHRAHNGTHSRLYGVWCNMKNRCYNKNVRSYKDYGMNGVTVCAEWLHDFGTFSKWASASARSTARTNTGSTTIQDIRWRDNNGKTHTYTEVCSV